MMPEKITCSCPFLILFNSRDCIYMDKFGLCEEIDINPGNSDAWCTFMIDWVIQSRDKKPGFGYGEERIELNDEYLKWVE